MYANLKANHQLTSFGRWVARMVNPPDQEIPFRAELLSIEQLALHAKAIAEQHKVGIVSGHNRLLARLGDNEAILQTFNRATLRADQDRRVTPAAEWLLDNFYLIEEQIQMARRHLPRNYSRELPRLTGGRSARLPRVYDLVLELIAHVDAQIDIEHLSAFVGAYQAVTPLNMGELWAIPIMLRLGLIENLRRITTRLTSDREDRNTADFWADRLQRSVETDPSSVIVVVADMARAKLPASTAFVTEFCQRLSKLDPVVHIARNWIEQRLAEQASSVEQYTLLESQSQAADQVSISHTITSLRFLSATDWRDFVEAMSVVDQTLRNDPAGVYRTMDFSTRDQYRHSVERLARHSGRPENQVAWKAIELSEASLKEKGREDRQAHVGYYLIDKGQLNLEKAVGVKWPWRTLFDRFIRKFPMFFYALGIVAILAPSSYGVVRCLETFSAPRWELILFTGLAVIGLSQFAINVVNWLATLLVHPRRLPRMDFSEGIPAEDRAIVAVPTLLTGTEAITRLLETAEIHYLANRDKNLYIALLTDFRDAPQEKMPGDELLLNQISQGIESLNRKYQADRPQIFFLFQRPRQWNGSESVWMGYERKRGKLTQFNALLRGHGRERFMRIIGDVSLLPGVKFVITLDTDTQLPRDAARQLVGTMAHPLNRPQFDRDKNVVREGYGILQPRVGVSLPSASRSWFVRIFAGETGIDPYTRQVSDVYQDMFGEGSFIGKGIYDVDAFERAVHGRFPANTILSHDLIESLHARSGLISDVELYEEHPSRYNADINRRHRWIRGDWQIAQWLLPRVPGPDARNIANPLTGLSQWKIFDNLRRSLVPAALTFLLIGSWLLLPQLKGAGAWLTLGILFVPALLAIIRDAFIKPEEWPFWLHLKSTAKSTARQLAQIFLSLAFLPYDAFISLDAIARTWVRVLFTRKQLLEWQTASDAERNANTSLAGFYQTMWIAPAGSAAVAAVLLLELPEELFYAAPFLFIWLAAPVIAWWISRPIVRAAPQLTPRQLAFLRRAARRTWRFFETFVTSGENWLPPDNFQEEPPVIAHRTSPTNLGLCLLANLSAYDFGYLTAKEMMERVRNTLGTMAKLERLRGHFYNWYDTHTLKPLLPPYISTVDSGNLAGHLLVLSCGLEGLAEQPVFNEAAFAGARDALGNLRELVRAHPLLDAVEELLAKPPADLPGIYRRWQPLLEKSSELARVFADHSEESKWWSATLEQTCREQWEELLFMAPWLPKLAEVLEKSESGTPLPSPAQKAAPPGGGDGHIESPTDSPPTIGKLLQPLLKNPTLRELSELDAFFGRILPEAEKLAAQTGGLKEFAPQLTELGGLVHQASERARQRIGELEKLAEAARPMADMDFNFLFDPVRELFTIGYNVVERRRDPGYYDLLASEARLGSYVAIAQGQIPQKNWFSLGRLIAATHGDPVLISWSGSMFEYLMPLLVMPTYENTLLDETNRAAVKSQIDYGKSRGTPWGISESGYNLTDAQMNYQYRAFGVPGLGFKRGLSEDLVIAPYASVMALMVAPREACENLQRLAEENRLGNYGFYEAVDYTPSRLPPNETSVTIRSFMVHHSGMSFLSLAYFLLDRPMQRRFLAFPPFKAEELLLQERVPKAITTLSSEDLEFAETRGLFTSAEGIMRVITTPQTPTPEVHLLSNGRYHVVISNAGGGYSRWQNLAVTRWREDSTRDCWGNFCYFRDVDSGEFWSSAYQPALQLGKRYEAIFTQARAEFRQRHGVIGIHTEIGVSPEDDVEMRRINLTNHSNETRAIEITTYAEVVLAPSGADSAHPAFSNLFVQTEFVTQHPALLCTRRARSEGEKPPWMFHLLAIQGAAAGELSYETDRSKFIGRGRGLSFPAALQAVSPLSNTSGSVLDPIVSLRRIITLPPQETVQIEIVMGVAETREATLALVEKYHNQRMADRLFDLAWTHNQVTLRQLDATESDAQLYARMAGALIYANPLRRAQPAVLADNRRAQSGLWSYGISGDAPIVMLRISDADRMDLVRQVVQAHAYWRLKGLPVELVIVNEDTSVYRQSLHDRIVSLIASGSEAQMMDRPGGIFVRRLEQIPAEDRTLLQSVARIILSDDKGTLTEQIERRGAVESEIPELKPSRSHAREFSPELPKRDLVFFNGIGGFTPDGREYVITLEADPDFALPKKNTSPYRFLPWQELRNLASEADEALTATLIPRIVAEPAAEAEPAAPPRPSVAINTPAPWVNVLANPRFGTVVSESGGAYTWLDNSHEFRLTPWNNDPVTDISGEAIYLRDDETGEFWSPMPYPARGTTPYVIRHGFGYSVFEHAENGISSETWVYVAKDAPVKFTLLKLRNLSGRPRKLSVVGYWEWVLSDLRSKSSLHVQTKIDSQTNALLARNPFNGEFADRIAFVDVTDQRRTVTGDRREFFGRNGTPANPAALKKTRLSGKTGAGFDPCAAIQVQVELPDERERELTFRLGAGQNLQEAQDLIQRYRSLSASKNALKEVRAYWSGLVGAVQVETPNVAANILANGWLMYQTLSARLWGRTGFYQSGGAFGFRDQLQDAMALVHAEPALLREQLLRAAARQFLEGDVQHWWHPPSGRGVRTHFSDDYLWLPYAACRYLHCLKDTGILDEKIPFLEGRALKPEEESYYDLPHHSQESGTFYEHCVRAIEYGLKFGAHGLPLIGCGDWNDGFNRIGEHGKGESVWLAFFLFEVLKQFSDIARQRGDIAFAARCLSQAETLRLNIEANAWDGQWYCRAYFDNGEPIGSHTNQECQIDSLPQSWAVLTGATDPGRARQAMRAVEQRLVRREANLIQLFDPPFDKSAQNPGYIKGYVPGVRENGGQYTHGAIWTVMAFAQRGDFELAWELFSLLNPINHGRTAAQIAAYKVEPYVVAADVYAVSPHVGRGGWTWYTGSAGWMYRLVIESLLGVTREGDALRLQPRIPADWRGFKLDYRYRNTAYHFVVKQNSALPRETLQIRLDGRPLEGGMVPLIDDRQEHQVEVVIGSQTTIAQKEAAIEFAPLAK